VIKCIRCLRNLSLAGGFLLCTFAAIEPSAAQSEDRTVLQQRTAKSNAVFTVVTPSSPSALTDLQQRKQQSIHDLNKRAEDLVHAWKLRQVRQAIADIKAQQEKDALIAAAAAAQEEALRNQALAPPAPAPPVLTVPTLLQPTPMPTAEVASPEPSDVADAPLAATPPQQRLQPETVDTQAVTMPESDAVPIAAPADDAEANAVSSVDGPIDRMALASSLFATESYKECLSILKAVDQKSISTENRDWCDFLAASCYRKLNDLPEAESRYRSLLGRTEVSWLANATRWWLDHLNEQQKLRGDLRQLRTNFTAWQGEIDAIRDAD